MREELAAVLEALEGAPEILARQSEGLEALLGRLERPRLQLAVLGQFKRGKSSLLDALLGVELLPRAVVPLTAIPTLLHHAERPRLRVFFQRGGFEEEHPADLPSLRRRLDELVTEPGNPGNRLGIERVELGWPSPLLDQGVALVDTPGIGSTFRHNTEAALAFLEQCDAALFVLSADPPLTEAELDYLQRVRALVPRIAFVLNKVDLLDAHERREAEAFLRLELGRAGFPGAELYPLSAREALRDRLAGGDGGPGLLALERGFLEPLLAARDEALRGSVARKAAQALRSLRLSAALALRSARMPLSELDRRLDSLGRSLDALERELLGAQDRLEGDRRRLAALLKEQSDALYREAEEALWRAVQQGLDAGEGHAELEARLARAVEDFFPPAFARRSEDFRRAFRELAAAHHRRAEELVEAARRAAAEAFDLEPVEVDGEALELELAEPAWTRQHWEPSLSPLPEGSLDGLLPPALRRRRLERRFRERVERVAIRNVADLQWASAQELDRAFRRAGRELEERLAELRRATESALLELRRRREADAEGVAHELARIEAVDRAAARALEALEGLV